MRPARLGEAPHQRVGAGVEEDARIATPSPRSSSSSGSRCGSEPALRTSTAIATRRSSARARAQELAQQLGRQVVDAEEAGVFERVQRDRLARARDAGDQHDLGGDAWRVSRVAGRRS
jgi:hypothetical protein